MVVASIRPGFCDMGAMCITRKQTVNVAVGLFAASLTLAGQVMASEPQFATAGGLAIGEAAGGVTDRAFITAPPNYLFVVEREPGSFLDCGAGQDVHATDTDGRDMAILRCGVTLTETIVIPAAAESARIIVHY